MTRDRRHWQGHYSGTPEQQYLQRHFSYSDRIRYYWTQTAAVAAVDRLLDRLAAVTIPETLVSQYLGRLYPAVAAGRVAAEPRALCGAAIAQALAPYRAATTWGGSSHESASSAPAWSAAPSPRSSTRSATR